MIHDSYAPPVVREEVVYVDRSVEQAAPAAGEGSIQAPDDRAAAPANNGTASAGHVNALGRAASQYLTLGDDAFRQGRFSDAVHFYARAVELSPDDGVLYLILSDALFATGDYHYSAYALRRSLELDPTLTSSIVDKHTFYGDPTEFDRQLEVSEKYLQDHFMDDDARLVLAANYLFGNRPAQAADMLQSAFSLEVRQSSAGKILLERAQDLMQAGKSGK